MMDSHRRFWGIIGLFCLASEAMALDPGTWSMKRNDVVPTLELSVHAEVSGGEPVDFTSSAFPLAQDISQVTSALEMALDTVCDQQFPETLANAACRAAVDQLIVLVEDAWSRFYALYGDLYGQELYLVASRAPKFSMSFLTRGGFLTSSAVVDGAVCRTLAGCDATGLVITVDPNAPNCDRCDLFQFTADATSWQFIDVTSTASGRFTPSGSFQLSVDNPIAEGVLFAVSASFTTLSGDRYSATLMGGPPTPGATATPVTAGLPSGATNGSSAFLLFLPLLLLILGWKMRKTGEPGTKFH